MSLSTRNWLMSESVSNSALWCCRQTDISLFVVHVQWSRTVVDQVVGGAYRFAIHSNTPWRDAGYKYRTLLRSLVTDLFCRSSRYVLYITGIAVSASEIGQSSSAVSGVRTHVRTCTHASAPAHTLTEISHTSYTSWYFSIVLADIGIKLKLTLHAAYLNRRTTIGSLYFSWTTFFLVECLS